MSASAVAARSTSPAAALSSSAPAAHAAPLSAAAASASSSSHAILSLDADENPLAGDGGAAPQLITLISKEGRRLPVSRAAIMASELCKTTLEGDRDATEIPLYHIEGAIVAKVIEYLTYHLKIPARKIEKPLVSNNLKDLVDKWDVNFIDNGESVAAPGANPLTLPPPSAAAQEMLFKLLLAANYLNIKSLLQLTCAKVASLMRGKTPDAIRSTFNIRNDYTQAEEEEVRKEYKDLIG